jgi:hypothetical protein
LQGAALETELCVFFAVEIIIVVIIIAILLIYDRCMVALWVGAKGPPPTTAGGAWGGAMGCS